MVASVAQIASLPNILFRRGSTIEPSINCTLWELVQSDLKKTCCILKHA